jgi:hypothetical protein
MAPRAMRERLYKNIVGTSLCSLEAAPGGRSAKDAPWVSDERRLTLRAKLDALYFHLYGVTETSDVKYIYSTFPIVEKVESATFGSYRSRDLCLAHMSALAAGDPRADIRL